MKKVIVVAFAVVSVVTPLAARADDEVATNEEVATDEEPARTRSYALSTLAIDLGVVAPIAIAGLSTDSVEIAAAAPVVFVAGAPIVHLLHGRPGAAALSFAMRTVAALGAVGGHALVGSEKEECDRSNHCTGYLSSVLASAPLVAGVPLAVSLIDALVLAKEQTTPKRAAFIPNIAPRREGGVQLGWAGTF
jgi:hypothetical protein